MSTTETARQSKLKQKVRENKDFLIWISFGLNSGQVGGEGQGGKWDIFGKGYVVQSRKLSKQQCDELGSRFNASAHLYSHANLICMFLSPMFAHVTSTVP